MIFMKSGWLLFTKRSISTQTNYRHILLETYRRQESGRLSVSIKDVYDDVNSEDEEYYNIL